MTRVPGTDLFYHSMELPSDARANYLFIADYEETEDPRNPRRTSTTLLGKDMEMSRSGEAMAMSRPRVDWFTASHSHLCLLSHTGRGQNEIVLRGLRSPPPGVTLG